MAIMKLYHGTSERFLERILKNGLQPRGRRKTNYKQNPSHPGGVYLTNAYALYYAMNVCNRKDNPIVVEVDTERPSFNPFCLAPDEDALEQTGRARDGIPGDMYERTKHYVAHLEQYANMKNVDLSLRALGNCCYLGTVMPSAITRIVRIERPKQQRFIWSAMDPSIVIMNYYVCGPKYRNMVRWLFEETPLEPDPLSEAFRYGFTQYSLPDNRDGIKYVFDATKEFNHGTANTKLAATA
jgi:hypothetical protein